MVGSPVLFIVVPLLAAFLIPLLGYIWKELVRILPGLVLLYLLVLSVSLMGQVMHTGTIVEVIAGWAPPWGINLVFSPLTGLLTTLMLFMGFIIWIYSYHFKNVGFEPSKKYFIALAFTSTLMVIGIIFIGITFYFGIGTWGNNDTISWGFAITNFVFWVGIAHAGSFTSAILYLLRQRWRSAIARLAEIGRASVGKECRSRWSPYH